MLSIFRLVLLTDIFDINGLALILKIIGHKTILQASILIATSITTRPFGLSVILAILSVFAFITDVILYLLLLAVYNSSVFGQVFRMEHQYIKNLDFASKCELHQNNILNTNKCYGISWWSVLLVVETEG